MPTGQEPAAPGTLFGVGVGPGDPELMTIKAQRILKEAPVLCVPKSREEGESYVLSFVKHLIDPRRQRLIELVFPMTRDREVLEQYWRSAVEKVLEPLMQGQDVAFATEGDPSIYSTFMHLHDMVREVHPEIKVEVVPAVSSINASAAVAGIPLVDGGERLAVIPAVYEGEDVEAVLRQFETVVFLKVNRAFDRILNALERLDLAERAVYVKRCGSPDQEVVHDVRTLRGAKLDYLSLMIVRR